jgi:chromosome segregation ATPase
MADNPKSSVNELLRKLKYATDNAIKNLQSFNETLGELMPRVEEVEHLEQRAAVAKHQLDDATRRYREIEVGLEEAKREYSALQAQLSVPATLYHELQTKVKSF